MSPVASGGQKSNDSSPAPLCQLVVSRPKVKSATGECVCYNTQVNFTFYNLTVPPRRKGSVITLIITIITIIYWSLLFSTVFARGQTDCYTKCPCVLSVVCVCVWCVCVVCVCVCECVRD